MSSGDIFEIARQGLVLVFFLSLPMLGAAFLAAVLSALLQAFLKINEPALSHLPKIAAVFLAALIAAPWISARIAGFATRVWSAIGALNP